MIPSAPTQTGLCLFSAPHHFLGGLRAEFERLMPTRFQEIWRREELHADPAVIAWVVNPGQQFKVDAAALQLFPRLSVVVTPSTGSNHIDLEACRARGVEVRTLLEDREELSEISASAEFTFLLLLNTLRRLDRAARVVSAGGWRTEEDPLRGNELQGKRVGLVGLGRIGKRMARYCAAFGARAIYHDPYARAEGAASVSLEELFSQSDAVCLCCGLTPETAGMIGARLLRRLKPGACLVNSSRGEVIREQELADLLNERKDLRVGLDVLAGETTGAHLNSPLLPFHRTGQILITPHVSGLTVESQSKAARISLGLLRQIFSEKR